MSGFASSPPGWTEARVELLKSLHAQGGLSCAEIAKKLGGGISRNAVIGKVTRLGLARTRPPSPPKLKSERRPVATDRRQHAAPPKLKAERQPAATDRPQQAAPPRSVAPPPSPPPSPVLVGGDAEGVDLVALGEGCKWPIGDRDGLMLFCGCARPRGEPYCAMHASQSFKRSAGPAERAAAAKTYHKSIIRLAARIA